MRLGHERRRLVIRGAAGPGLVVGAALIAGGACFVAAALGLFGFSTGLRLLYRAAIGMLGSIGVVAGVWVLWRAQPSSVVVDRVGRTVTMIHREFSDTTAVQYAGSAVADVRVTKERDGRGAAVYRVELVLDTGGIVSVPLFRPHDRTRCMRAAQRLGIALGLQKAREI